VTGSVLALDVGGTKMAAAIVDREGRVLRASRDATPQGGDAESLWQVLMGAASTVVDGVDIVGVGVGCGGPMTWPEGEVSPLNIPGWRAFPLRRRVEERFSGVPVRLHNDAVCTAVGEHWLGAGRGTRDMLGMVVSTGVGGGLVLGGRLADGGTGNAGHIGHVIVDPAGPECSCGGLGCLEALASGPRLTAWAAEQGWRAGKGGSGRELAHDAAGGDPVALAAMTRAGAALGLAIASTTHLCDLEVVAISGGLAQAGALLFDPLEAALRRHARMAFARRVTQADRA
jgi:glucokinase